MQKDKLVLKVFYTYFNVPVILNLLKTITSQRMLALALRKFEIQERISIIHLISYNDALKKSTVNYLILRTVTEKKKYTED